MGNDATDPIAEGMLRRRVAGLIGGIKPKQTADLLGNLTRLQLESLDPINLVIDSAGGDADEAFAVHDFIRYMMTAPVHALVLGTCDSAATFVLLACESRRSMPHAHFMIHSGTISNISMKLDRMSEPRAEMLLAEMKTYSEYISDFYCGALNLPRERIDKLIARGDQQFNNKLSAKEALEVGLITEIVKERLPIFPKPD